MKTLIGIILLLSWLSAVSAAETPAPSEGEVRVPLPVYNQLVENSREQPVSAPAAYAIGQSRVNVELVEADERTSAQVTVEVMIEVFEDRWTLVPVLPLGVALSEVSVDGQPAQLVQGLDGLSWSAKQAGAFTLRLRYGVDAIRSERGFTLPLPIPRAAATELTLSYPGTGLDLAIVPAADQRHAEQNGITRISASIPAAAAVMISWRTPGKHSHVVSRARYRGELVGQAVVWRAQYQVELFTGEPIRLALLPASVTLVELSVDGQAATVLAEDDRFTTLVQGRGPHEVEAVFQTPVRQPDGLPRIELRVPPVPMSQFELRLPGDKDVKVTPPVNVTTVRGDGKTEATAFMPMVEKLSFAWLEAVPEDLQTQVRANASLYHALYAEEGVLYGQALVAYEITRGETNLLHLTAPADAQINRIQGDGVVDWSVTTAGEHKRIKVFLDRAVKGDYLLTLFYEQLLGADRSASLAAPLLQALAVHRQRGMAALLAGQELTLKPVTAEQVSAVGENQLPAFVRNQIALPVAHTFKYIEPPALIVAAVAPERKQGKFNAQVDTLISIGEVTQRGSATVEINVKSGAIMDLQLGLPATVNVLDVTGPALRSQQIQANEKQQSISLEFNREMDGQFRIEVNYERIVADDAAETDAPVLTVTGADVVYGRIAVEALTAVELQTLETDMSLMDINELPQQLVLKTTNPILMAYKYVHAVPPRLVLRMVRHREIEVQVAAIETAHYRTLITRDGLAVTIARFTVRNSRRQFLRLALPAKSQVWSALVDGKAEKPARAGGAEDAVLIKLINSAAGFPVEIVYATPSPAMNTFGILSGRLPRPDMVATHSRWDLYLPSRYRYLTPTGNLDVVVSGRWANPRSDAVIEAGVDSRSQALRIEVPTQGVHFRFAKLYANQSPEDTGFSITYMTREIGSVSLVLSGLGALLIWVGIFGLWSGRMPRSATALSFGSGIALLLLSIGYLETSPVLASVLSLAVALIWMAGWLVQQLRAWRGRRLDRPL